ncbi:glycogen debranching protein GlgX [Brachybacterium huguangmaarense]|uniref:Glycogen debranching protein GlgX n=1 Tax=Brachybacterium huguangmaarense TaxID=1652028 RepID=A0ABY6FYK7_9MICO|nr:glycogen debranching protein GlgX [Brachybacterium huguangmaarense]UYG15987.1 glycogen debranching protein GlgX [Brachybacterium huguangmaarense]
MSPRPAPALVGPAVGPPPPPAEPGLHVDASGHGTFGVHAPRAQAVDLCVRHGAFEHRIRLDRFDGGMWWGDVEGLTPGTHYGLRVYGPWDPGAGCFANPHKVLLDPRGVAVSHSSPLLSSMFGHEVDALLRPVAEGPLRMSTDDNADQAVWSVVGSPHVPVGREGAPRTPWGTTVLYEAHVRGFTALHPDLPPELRGTYAGLGHDVVTRYLRDLGVTAIELLPIHAAMDEAHLARTGLTNYWGYSTLSYFAPEPSYATRRAQEAGPGAVLEEVRAMVRSLHAAGIEVICDVVYNHSAEGGADGPSLSLRGLDAADYYWMDHGSFVDFTGTGNSLNMRSGHVVDLILASMRHWVQDFGIDGFRFDLAATLGRDDRGFRADHPLLRAITTDPVLRDVKLIAEPWDVGGYGWRTGGFPPPFAEWNDAFRNDVRSFWLEDPGRRERTGTTQIGGVRDIATRLAGSEDVFARHDPPGLAPDRHLRAPWASVNYVTAHDGFTLRDLTEYETKHNLANGEDNRDGTSDNRSYNHGHEGPLDASVPDADRIAARRRRSARSVMATLLLASGTPMITAGDEALRTQGGNNNAYCQDTRISWVSWDRDEHELAMVEVTRALLGLRRRFQRLRPVEFLRDADPESPAKNQIAWFGPDGEPLRHEDWFDAHRDTLQMLRPGAPGEGHLVVVVNGARMTKQVRLPGAPWSGGEVSVLFSSADETAQEPYVCTGADSSLLEVPAGTVVVLLIGGDAEALDPLG